MTVEYENKKEHLNPLIEKIAQAFESDFVCLAILENRHSFIRPWLMAGISDNNFPLLKIGKPSLSNRAIESRKPVVWRRSMDAIEGRMEYKDREVNSEAVIPVIFENSVTGIIVIGSSQDRDYGPFLYDLEVVANQWSIIFQQRLFLDVAVRISNLNFANQDISGITQILARTGCEVAETPITTVRLLDGEDEQYLRLMHSEGSYDSSQLEPYLLDLNKNDPSWETFKIAVQLLEETHFRPGKVSEKKLLRFVRPVNDLTEFENTPFGNFIYDNNLQTMVTIPIVTGSRVLGVVNTYARRKDAFNTKQLYFLMILAGSAANAIEKERLRLANENLKNKTIEKANDLLNITRRMSFYTLTRHVNHEVKNLLFQLANELEIVQSKVLKSGKNDEKQKIKVSKEKCTRIAEQIVRVVDQYKIEDSSIEILDLNELILEYIDFFSYTSSGEEILINPKLSKDIPLIRVDQEVLNIIIYNLLSNALDAIPTGKRGVIDVSTEVIGDFIIISITDNGVGIGNEINDKIYEPYFTTKKGGKVKKGTGLGLYHVRSLLHSLGGEINHNSSVGRGAKFKLSIPIVL